MASGLEGRARWTFASPEQSVATVLRMLGTGPGGRILMALGRRPLRTKQLTDRVPDFSSRSVYRSVGRMETDGFVERHEEPGVPSTVVLRLTDPFGRNLFRLLRSFVTDARAGFHGSSATEPPWMSLHLLGELWGLGFVEELSHGSRSLTDLIDGDHRLSYHQVKRRTGLFVDGGLLVACANGTAGKHYELTDHGRRCMALVCAIGRWRHRHLVAEPTLEIEEMVTVIRTALPLALLPEQAGMNLDLVVAGVMDRYGERTTRTLCGAVGEGGAMRLCDERALPADGSATATTNTWSAALLDGNRGRMRVRGDLGLVDAFLTHLYDVLWTPAEA